jgi:hypothetical protein
MKRVIFKIDNTLCVIRLGDTSNPKISAGKEVVIQTYHFSRSQFEIVKDKITMTQFFEQDKDVCLDCPFAVSNGAKVSDCYTHEYNQYSGFLSMLRSIRLSYSWDTIPEYSKEAEREILKLSAGRFIRFGTYGEPSLLPVDLTRTMCAVAKNWTGYTHQHNKRPEFAPYYMASVHDLNEAEALPMWRSFVASPSRVTGLIPCPASKEMNNVSNCSKCGLCSGTSGKGKKSVNILLH